MPNYFATCARGLEPILADELRALGAEQVEAGRGGASFAGDRRVLYKANLWLRTAVRVLQPILEADVYDPDELYNAVQTLDWAEYMTPGHTLAVDCNVRDSRITHSQYASRRVKDAICDQFVSKLGIRPSVDTERPMVGLNLHIHRDHAILSLDSCWDSLHKRGYRPALNRAPLNEALAAGLIQSIGYDGSMPLHDPMCGSGAIVIEAAWIAMKRPPGLTRKHFGFMGWMDFEIGEWATIRDDARAGMLKQLPAYVGGSDIRTDALEYSRGNAKGAGIGSLVQFMRADVKSFIPPEGPPGLLICNPPYGERIGDIRELKPVYRAMGETFRRCEGWKSWVFTSLDAPWREIGKPIEAIPFWNGKIACKLFRFT
jgi:putative N6-adenine-specific DNA methylase